MEKIDNTIDNSINNQGNSIDSEVKAITSRKGVLPIVNDGKESVDRSHAAYGNIHTMPHKAFDALSKNLRRVGLVIVSLNVAVVVFILVVALVNFIGEKTQKTLPVVITPVVDYEVKSNVDVGFSKKNQEPANGGNDTLNVELNSDALEDGMILNKEMEQENKSSEGQEFKIGDLIPIKESEQVVQGDGGENLILPLREKLLVIDTDSDGLSDLEEVVFGFNRDSEDTDENGVNDYDELIVLFENSKNNSSDGSLLSVYENKGYSLIYPTEWLYVGDQSGFVSWKAGSNHTIQVLTISTSGDYSDIDSWYTNEVSAKNISNNRRINGKNWNGVVLDNDLVAYVMSSDKTVFIISYIPFATDEAVYGNLFKIMVDYFVVK